MNAARFSRERGVVLLLTLIVLVAMMLAGVSLMRSVTSGLLVAGNLGLKRAATASAELGIQQGFSALQGLANTDVTIATMPWYHPTWALDFASIDWDRQASAEQNVSGHSVRYVVQRLCAAEGGVTPAACVVPTGTRAGSESSARACDVSCYGLAGGAGTYYKITARARGVKGAESFVQVIVQR